MKLLFENKRYIVLIFLTTLMVFGAHISGYANIAPVFSDGTSTTRAIAENAAAGQNIGTAVAATDPDSGDTLTYTLDGDDAAAFSLVSTSGQLQTRDALDYETKSSYSVTVSVSDGKGGSDSIEVTISVTDANDTPVFTDGTSTTRAIAENTIAGTNIGTAIAATDQDGNTLSYTLGGRDAAAFSIVGTSGQLQTRAALNYEIKSSYLVSVSVSDGNAGSASIEVTISVTDVTTEKHYNQNEVITTLPDGFWAADATSDDVNWKITERFGTVITYPTAGGWMRKGLNIYTCIDADGCRIEGRTVKQGKIEVTPFKGALVNNAPVFTEGTSATRAVAENTASIRNIGAAVAATDADTGDTLTYSLSGTDASSFSIVSTSGQLQTRAALDYETKTSYSVTVSVSDGKGESDSITVTINVTDVNEAPSFPTERATRSVAENTASGANIGDPFQATDPDSGDTVTYSLHRGDAGVFRIDASTGQLRTHKALDFETKNVYNDLAIRATDNEGNFDAIFVTINVTDANDAPSFPTDTAPLSVAENTASGTNIGDPFQATDPDGDTLTYSLHRRDADVFRIDASTGQLRTHKALDFETKNVYNDLAIRATDNEGNFTALFVTINVTDVNENRAPSFSEGNSATRSIAENTASGVNIGSAVAATDADTGDTLTYTLSGTDAAAFSIVSTSGQLQTNAALDYETKASYSVTVSVSDGNGESVSIDVTISVTDVNENSEPVFSDGDSTTRTVAENTASGQNIGTMVAATDTDNDTLTYSLGGDDAAAFSIVSTSGQLQTRAALDYEVKNAYSVTVSVSDGNGGSDSITVTINVTDANDAPSFPTERATLSVAENTARGTNIGDPFQATDPDSGDTVTYSLHRGDAGVFRIDASTGQLRTHMALDFETKKVYNNLAIRATDNEGNFTALFVTINVTDANDAPSFPTERATLSVAENTARGTNIGDPFQATDPDGDTVTYSLHRGDAGVFRINASTGQLRTHMALDFETKNVYNNLAIRATDNEGNFTALFVTINVTDVDENRAPVFSEGNSATRTIAENTTSGVNIGSAIAATDPDTGDTLTYTLGGTDASAFSIVSTSGQLQTSAALDYETKSSYSVSVSVSDGNGGSDSIIVSINVTDVNENRAPAFADGDSTTRTVAENTASGVNIGTAIAATDADNDTLTYSLGGDDASSFSIISTSGQLQTRAALDYETKSSYVVTVTASDGSLTDNIPVTINVRNVNEAPNFTDGSSATRTIAENTASGTNIGAPVAATDPENDTLTYSLSGTDASSFSIVSTSGQLQTNVALDYETKASYSVTVSVSDGKGGTDSIAVTVNVTDVDENRAPAFIDGASGASTTRSVAENTPSGRNIGTAIAATDPDNDVLTYRLSGTDADAFSIDTTSGQLQTKAPLNYETKRSYTVIIFVADGKGRADHITVTINVTRAPVFIDGIRTTRSVAENTPSGRNIGIAVDATDGDSDTLTYSLSGPDAASFSIVSMSGQLQTKAALDYETKSSYAVTVSVSDGSGGSDSITVTINVTDVNENRAPAFSDGASITLSVAENTASGVNIGSAIAATDPDTSDTLTYTLGGTDASSFSLVSTSGQLQTSAALDYETKPSYSVSVSVSDGNGGSDSIAVTINVTDVNENRAPAFADGDSTTRTIAENTASGVNIGTAIAATDADNDTLTYSLGGYVPDADSFSLVSTSGQLQTSAALDYETKPSYSVSVSVSDGNGGSDSIAVTINVTDVNENRAPAFADGDSTTRTIAENTASGVNIGTAIAATDADTGDTLTYTLSGTNADSFSIVSTSGQLQTNVALDYETKSSYLVTITVSDGNGGSDSITVSIYVTDVNEGAPVFTDGDSTTRSVYEGSHIGRDIGAVVAATDPDIADTLTYSLGGTDAALFSIVSTTGRLQTKAALDYETKNAYSVTVSVSDGNGGSDSIAVTINVMDVDEHRPVFTDGASTTRTIAENTIAGQNIGTPVAATDLDGDTLEYTFSIFDTSPDHDVFSIDSTSGQITTKGALDFETKATYRLYLMVLGGSSGAFITVTINVTDVNEVPVFTDGDSTTRTIAENTASGQNIGTPVAATDPDTGDTLSYTLGGDDATSFSIVSTTGQLQTRAALNYETETSYAVTITASDGILTDSIDVTINVTDVNEVPGNNIPVFSDGTSTTRSIAENTASGVNIGSAVAATDADTGDTLTYTLGGPDASSFTIISTSGQLQTRAALDYEVKNAYSVTVLVSDGSASDSITVTINVTDVSENGAPVFTDGASTTRTIAENTAPGTNIGAPVAATDPENDAIIYTLGGDDAAAFSIISTSGQLQARAALDYETKRSYSVTVSASGGNGGSPSILVTISVTDVNEAPSFTDGSRTTRVVTENTASGQNLGTVVAATDPDGGDTLTYTLTGTDASSFSIVSTSGQLQTRAALDYEVKNAYSVTVSVSDSNGVSDSITVTIYVADVNEKELVPTVLRTPAVRDAIVRALPSVHYASRVTPADLATITELVISTPWHGPRAQGGNAQGVGGLEADVAQIQGQQALANGITLKAGDFAGLTGLKKLTLEYTRSVSDISALSVLTNLTHLSLDGNKITDISPLSGMTKLRKLYLRGANFGERGNYIEDISALSGMTKLRTLWLHFNNISDLTPLSNLTNLDDLQLDRNNFSDISALSGLTKLRVLSLWNNKISNISAVSGMTKLEYLALSNNLINHDNDNDYNNSITDVSALSGLTLLRILYLRNNPVPASQYSTLRTLKNNHSLSIIDIDLNNSNLPVFAEGDSTTRSVAEGRMIIGTNIGAAVAATDADNDTLTYYLNGTDADLFRIVSTSGQLQTYIHLDYETKTSHTVTVYVSDGNVTDSITVTINVTDVAGTAPSVQTLPTLPETTALLTNFPNPFNPETWIPYQLAEPAEVALTIYDIRGAVVRELKLGHQAPGFYQSRSRAIHWDGRNMLGEKVATGLYFYTLKAGDFTATRKLLIRK